MALRILIVDDSVAVQNALRALLHAKLDVEVVGCAEDRAGAMALIEERAPDLVVLDVELANRERGYDVLCEVRRSHPELGVIMLSNHGWQPMRKAYIDAGAQAYFDKSLEFQQAIDWIRVHGRPGG